MQFIHNNEYRDYNLHSSKVNWIFCMDNYEMPEMIETIEEKQWSEHWTKTVIIWCGHLFYAGCNALKFNASQIRI